MNTPKFLLAAALAAVAITPNVKASPFSYNVVYGNLGSFADSGLDSTNLNITASSIGAVAFNTGTSTSLNLTSITIGSEVLSSGNYTLSVYTGTSTTPNLSSLFASSTQYFTADGFPALHIYNFTGQTFSANTTYWIVAQSGQNWHAEQGFTTADEQNASGFAYIANRRSLNGGTSWSNYGVPLAVSVSAVAAPVPEASTYGIALGGLALVGAIVRRRRQAK